MEGPTVTQAYAMIRVLRKRGAKGDDEKIETLNEIVFRERDKRALLDLDKFFPTKK